MYAWKPSQEEGSLDRSDVFTYTTLFGRAAHGGRNKGRLCARYPPDFPRALLRVPRAFPTNERTPPRSPKLGLQEPWPYHYRTGKRGGKFLIPQDYRRQGKADASHRRSGSRANQADPRLDRPGRRV